MKTHKLKVGETMYETRAKKIKLFEKYRPVKFDDVLGQDKAVKQIKRVLQNGQ